MAFKRAERKRAKLRLALDGPAGSGKTYSALLLARGLVGPDGKIAMVDTEKGSGELYSDIDEYDYDQLTPPYSPERYIGKMREAASRYDCLIIDSISHAWSGEGGVLDMKDAATKASRSGNSFDAWRSVTPQHNRLVETMLGLPCHLIVTIRTKTEWEVVEDERGKKKPVKIGTKPEQREGLEYEFTTVLDLSVDGHVATASKDRTRIFDGRCEVITQDTGRRLAAWLDGGSPATPATPTAPAAPQTAPAQTQGQTPGPEPDPLAGQADAFLARIDELVASTAASPAGTIKALGNWTAKHRDELNALPASARKAVRTKLDGAQAVARAALDAESGTGEQANG